jgi:hypothetical protein
MPDLMLHLVPASYPNRPLTPNTLQARSGAMLVTRIFRGIVVSAAVVAAAHALAGCGSCGEPEARTRDPLSLIPADSIVVASVEVRPVLASPAYERIRRSVNPVSAYLGDCEYDPLPHIDRLWLGGGADVLEGKGVMVVMGPVVRDKVLECYRADARRDGLTVEEEQVKGVTVYSAGPGRLHLAWLDAKTAVVGDRDSTLAVLALDRGEGSSVRSNQTLFKLWERMAKGQHVAVAMLPQKSQLDRLGKVLPDTHQGLMRAEQLGLSLFVSKGLDIRAMLRLESGDSATKMAKQLGRDIEYWSGHEYAEIAGVDGHLKAMRVENAGPEITVTAHWTEAQVRSLAGLAVDSIDEIMRSGDPEKALRERFQKDGGAVPAQPADRPDGGPAPTGGDAAPASGDAAPAKAASDASR